MTWTIGNWTLHVYQVDIPDAVKQVEGNPDLQRWQWNVVFTPIGWTEYAQIDGKREDAIVAGLDAIQSIERDTYETRYLIITSGEDVTISAKPTMPISEFIPLALQAIGQSNPDCEWYLDSEQGFRYDSGLPIAVTGHKPTFLTPAPVNS